MLLRLRKEQLTLVNWANVKGHQDDITQTCYYNQAKKNRKIRLFRIKNSSAEHCFYKTDTSLQPQQDRQRASIVFSSKRAYNGAGRRALASMKSCSSKGPSADCNTRKI
ncbi:hypothetical protein ATANTOWER_022322 [Ataeniobius toweri]|uniref:Uncharacterized protein n=1 Tax=Ataeniobius toweri TaxID=208326 RepID=A0ABU7AHF7_9TELE|nr:hypothetical protein [Ataeniobius toweri]